MTVTRTLRLDEDLDEALEKMAREEGESVNALASRSLRKLVEWDVLADKLGMVQMNAGTLVRLIEPLTEEEVRDLGSWVGKEVWEPFITYRYLTATPDTALQSLQLLSRYASRFRVDYSVKAGRVVVIIRHSMGIKWSAFYEGAARAVFEDLMRVGIVSHITDELVTIEFQAQDESKGDEVSVPR